MENKERIKKMTVVNNGFIHLVLDLAFVALALVLCIEAGEKGMASAGFIGGLMWIVWGLHVGGFMVIQPNQSRVLTFFGRYSGTVVDNGFFWTNPFYVKRKLSLRARNMDVPPIKVNDAGGNPIMIGLVLVWRIKDTYKACFNIDVETTAQPTAATSYLTVPPHSPIPLRYGRSCSYAPVRSFVPRYPVPPVPAGSTEAGPCVAGSRSRYWDEGPG